MPEAHFSRYLESVESGETVLVCRRNVPIAELRPVPKRPAQSRPVGIDRGMVIPASFFEPLPDKLLDAFEGRRGSASEIAARHLHLPLAGRGRSTRLTLGCPSAGASIPGQRGLPQRPLGLGNFHQPPAGSLADCPSRRAATWTSRRELATGRAARHSTRHAPPTTRSCRPHHRDPFDRGLVSQAILHGMTIVTPDAEIARYPAPVLW